MAQLIDLGKIRFHFAGTWQPGAEYELNDVVRYGGHLYVYTAALSSTGHPPSEGAYWSTMMEGSRFRGAFDPAVTYHAGDLVAYGPRLYLAQATSVGGTPADADHNDLWALFHDGVRWRGDYTEGTAYLPGDLVYDGVSTRLVTVGFTAGPLPVELAREQPRLTLLARGSDALPNQVGKAGQVLVSDGTDPAWVPPRRWRQVAADHEARAGDLLLVDVSRATLSILLPPAPTVGDSVTVADPTGAFEAAGRGPLVRANGQRIEGRFEDLTLDVSATVEFVFSGSADGWKVL
jgi:hypothetical protein